MLRTRRATVPARAGGGDNRRGQVMRHPATFIIGIAVTALVLGAAPAAHAANPNNEHFTFTDSFTDPDFCGTGQEFVVTIDAAGTGFASPNQPGVDFALNLTVTVTRTSAETGATVISHVANRFTVGTISGDPAGIHIDEVSNIGLAGQTRLEHGGVLTLDAGVITVTETWDGEEFLSREITVNNGPHPNADNDELFCEVVTAALGL
jgi:hypothetical protein